MVPISISPSVINPESDCYIMMVDLIQLIASDAEIGNIFSDSVNGFVGEYDLIEYSMPQD